MCYSMQGAWTLWDQLVCAHVSCVLITLTQGRCFIHLCSLSPPLHHCTLSPPHPFHPVPPLPAPFPPPSGSPTPVFSPGEWLCAQLSSFPLRYRPSPPLPTSPTLTGRLPIPGPTGLAAPVVCSGDQLCAHISSRSVLPLPLPLPLPVPFHPPHQGGFLSLGLLAHQRLYFALAIGSVLLSAGRYEDALEQYDAAEEEVSRMPPGHPNSALLHSCRAFALNALGRLSLAFEHLVKVWEGVRGFVCVGGSSASFSSQ